MKARLLLSAAVLLACAVRAQAEDLSVTSSVTVHGTPLPSLGLDLSSVPAPVQTLTAADLERSNSVNFGQYLSHNLTSVQVNDSQNNPFQPDISFRGYTASPLLGTPEGLSVYMDGVRQNQPFGDVVNWDLVPSAALRSAALMPGSNPLFGLNTLGGALSITTKNGLTDPGSSVETYYGSYNRRSLTLQHGGFSGPFDWYAMGTLFKDDGWRDHSPSEVRQLFGKLGWQDEGRSLHLSIGHADNNLMGTGLQEQRFLARDYASAYTYPDKTHNTATAFNLEGQQGFGGGMLLSGNVYYRTGKTSTYNGDINDDSLDQSVYQLSAAEITALRNAGYSGFPLSGASAANTPFPKWRCIGQALLRDEPAEKCNGVINRTASSQRNYGFAAQISFTGSLGGLDHSAVLGLAFDGSDLDFTQSSELGYLTSDRTVVGVGAFGDGVTGGSVDGAPYDTRVNLKGGVKTYSLFASDTINLSPAAELTLSARYDRSAISNFDRILPAGAPGTLTAKNRFSRLNPAVGLTWSPSETLTFYAGYNEGSRAPSSIELGCADPANPCKLPNAFAGDPPLKQVVARTIETGLRGTLADFANLTWSAGLFRSTASNDILFVSSSATGFGYYRNFGKTRRQGLELSASGEWGNVGFGGNYALLDATFRSPETVHGTGNSGNDQALAGRRGLEGTIAIAPGNVIPLSPRHSFKAHLDYAPLKGLRLGAESFTTSGFYARGNENNRHQPDGIYYLGPGKTKGYTTLALNASYDWGPGFCIFLRADNVWDEKYSTSAQIAGTGFDANGNYMARPLPPQTGQYPVVQATFYSPGAPRLLTGGLKYRF